MKGNDMVQRSTGSVLTEEAASTVARCSVILNACIPLSVC